MVGETASGRHRPSAPGPPLPPGERRKAQGSPKEAGNPTFRIQPQAVRAYAEVLRGQALRLARIETDLGAVALDETWLGALPGSTRLMQGIHLQRAAALEELAEVAHALAMAGEQLAGNVATYAKADGLVAEAFGRIGRVGWRGR
jgi:hypothetical protein